jgi:uncharacterized protein
LTLSIEQAAVLYADNDPVHDFAHVLRVLALAERLAEQEGADREIVRTAVLLHDISRTGDDNHNQGFALNVAQEEDHAMGAAHRAREILRGSSPEFVDAVVHAIEAHRYRNAIVPQTIEAKVVFDADKLDAIGAIGIARAFAYAGGHHMPLWGRVSPDYQPGISEEFHTPLHEFHVKLQKIKDRLYTESGRALAEARHAFMVTFFEQIDAEVEGAR